MKKITYLIFCIALLVTDRAISQFLIKETFFETTGVSNEGVVSGYEQQAGPYTLWNPDEGTTVEIGGLAPGNGIGGSARFSADGKYISGTGMQNFVQSIAWQKKVLSDYNYIFKAIDFPEDQNDFLGYAIGQSSTSNGNGIFLRSASGGSNWEATWVDDMNRGLECMSFPSFATGYVAGWNKYFAKTTNTGWDWEVQNPAGVADVYIYTAMKFKDDSNGVVGAQLQNGVAIYVTADGGTTWATATGVAGVPNKIAFSGGDTYFLVTYDGKIQKSTDNGLTWSTVYTNNNAQFLGIRFFDSAIGIATAQSNIYKTTNGGQNWTEILVEEGINWRDVAWLDPNKLVLAGNQDRIYESNNGGTTWTWANQAQSNGDPALYEITATSSQVHVCGSQGNFYSRNLNANLEVAEMSIYDVTNQTWQSCGNLGVVSDGTVSAGFNISGNGKTIVGNSWASPAHTHAVAWNASEGIINLGSLYAADKRSTRANAISHDGEVVVGWQDFNGPWKSAMWKRNPAGGYFQNEYLLIDPMGSSTDEFNQLGECSAISANGKWIGGYGDFANNNEPWVWSESTGAINLGTINGGTGSVSAINNNGSIVVGWFNQGFFDPQIPFIWSPTFGLHNLNDFIQDSLNIPLGDTVVYIPNQMSLNGRFISGWGFDFSSNEFGDLFAFRLQMPEKYLATQQQASTLHKITIHPNPVSQTLYVTSTQTLDRIEIFNANGQRLLTQNASDLQAEINMSPYASGIYFIKTVSEKMMNTHKFIKN